MSKFQKMIRSGGKNMIAGIVIGAIIILVIWYFISKEFLNIAKMKGHQSSRYFWWTFFFSFVGMAMVIALPDRARTAWPVETAPKVSAPINKSRNEPSDELPDL